MIGVGIRIVAGATIGLVNGAISNNDDERQLKMVINGIASAAFFLLAATFKGISAACSGRAALQLSFLSARFLGIGIITTAALAALIAYSVLK